MNAERPSTLLSDVELAGTLNFRGHLTFNGHLAEGDINGEDLVVGPQAVIEGNIRANSLVLHGAVTGEVHVKSRCEITSTASLQGSLVTATLKMHDGAVLIGSVKISRDGGK